MQFVSICVGVDNVEHAQCGLLKKPFNGFAILNWVHLKCISK